MSDVTRILAAVASGDGSAAEQLLDVVYADLRRMAAARMRREAPGQTLQTTGLVHEAYLRLFSGSEAAFENRAHFFAAAGEAMRRILIDRARRRGQAKRGGGRQRLSVDDLPDVVAKGDPEPADLLAVHEALSRLEAFDPRAATIVKLRCFVGMSIPDVAKSLALSTRTVNRDWQTASAWLRAELAEERDSSAP
jgi:RNA polymerase sigma factor (TIGR02999 family)